MNHDQWLDLRTFIESSTTYKQRTEYRIAAAFIAACNEMPIALWSYDIGQEYIRCKSVINKMSKKLLRDKKFTQSDIDNYFGRIDLC